MKPDTPEQMAERLASQEPERGSTEREDAVRAHARRIVEMTRERTGKTPSEIERILRMPHPECDCPTPKVRQAHGTFICEKCGGIAVTAAADHMRENVASTIRQERDGVPNPTTFPKDDLGRYPVCFNQTEGTPVKCLRCEAEGKLVYAGFAAVERQVYCPRGHTKTPKSVKFTQRLLQRSKAKA